MAQPLGTIRPEDFRQIREVFESALAYASADRAHFVERACSGDVRLMSEVQRMLEADKMSHPLLDGECAERRDLREGGRYANHFEIAGILGRGGMGEVYLGRDTNLNRDVAIKVLSAAFTRDPERLARFRREAQVLASLNHPNIGAIYSFEESDGIQALALEYVEGPTLAERIARGAIPLEETLSIARQIAEALETAHEQGIVHRDLKPGNVKLRPDGVVKVLDFGLAKALQSPEQTRESGSDSPHLTSPAMIAMGMIIGTPAYMSPEQAKGRAVDRRADIWAFGAVLYEMLAGRRAFKGEDTPETLASVLQQQVDWLAIPASTPAALRRLIERCLERDPRQRLRDIGEARLALESAGELDGDERPRSAPWRSRALILVALSAALLTATAAWYLRPDPAKLEVTRLFMTTPQDQILNFPMTGKVLAISPDGRELVYAANERLYLRHLSELQARPILGTENFQGVTDPVFSPDGRWLAFYARGDRTLRRIAVSGGAALRICQADTLFGLSWGQDGIYFGQGRQGILRVSPQGGEPQVVVRVEDNEQAHGPQLLPGGTHLLFTVATGAEPDRWHSARVVLTSLASGSRSIVIDGGSDAQYVPTGHLVYGHRGNLLAVPFDIDRMKVTGGPEAVVEEVLRAGASSTGVTQTSFSANGNLVYLPGADVSRPRFFMGFTDRNGKIERLDIPLGRLKSPRISPDGARIAFAPDFINTTDEPGIVWVYDLRGKEAPRRLTYGGTNRYPIWTSDSRKVVFQSDREGDPGIFWQRADGTEDAERLTRAGKGEAHFPEAWSPDSKFLLYSIYDGSVYTLWTLSPKAGVPAPFGGIRSYSPTGARFSPDGKWIAYASSERTGPTNIYVQPFPATGAKNQLTVKGSNSNTPHKPIWSPDGRELFYVPRFAEFEVVKIRTEPEFAFGDAVAVPRAFQPGSPNARTLFDMTPDGRFLAMFDPDQLGPPKAPREIAVVLNWFEDLRTRVPAP